MNQQISTDIVWYFLEKGTNLHVSPEWYFDLLFTINQN